MFYSLVILIATLAVLIVFLACNPLLRWRWKMRLKQARFEYLYRGIDGFRLSLQARDDPSDPNYLYGEIDYLAFAAALSLTRPRAEDVFYDLGSGTGKAVIAAALSYPMKAYYGLEALAPLHEAATAVRAKLMGVAWAADLAETIHFVQGDFLEQDFSDASLVFINATGFFSPLWETIVARLECVKPGTRLLISSKSLPARAFDLLHETQALMSWGPCHLRVYKRSQIP